MKPSISDLLIMIISDYLNIDESDAEQLIVDAADEIEKRRYTNLQQESGND